MASNLPPTTNLPPNLKPNLADPEIPWNVSDGLFQRALHTQGADYKKCEILPTDLEWDFVHRYFNASKPINRSIKRIFCILNPDQTNAFLSEIRNIEGEASNPKFAPAWDKESESSLRKDAITRWKTMTNSYSPFKIQWDTQRSETFSKTRILPLWHGTSEEVCHSVCKSGFAIFGKHAYLKGGKNDNSSTDLGFFGSGIYFTNSAHYAATIYGRGHLLMAWVSMREPFPVVADKRYPDKPSDMKTLEGLHAFKNYNAHVVPVVSIKPQDKMCSVYYPCAKGQNPVWDEIVVFQKSQTLPRFWIELQIDLPAPMPPTPLSVQKFIELVDSLITNPEIQNDPALHASLQKKSQILVTYYSGSEPLTPKDKELYQLALQVLDVAKKVQINIAPKFVELSQMHASLPGIHKRIPHLVSIKPLLPHYFPRRALLNKLEQALLHKPAAVHILYGPGGVGKSELAISFANLHQKEFSLVWHIPCGTPEEKIKAYRELAAAINMDFDPKTKPEDVIERIHAQLGRNSGKPWLIIFDNLNAPAPIPERGGVVLITAYSKKFEYDGTEVPLLSREEGIELIETITKKKSEHFQKLFDITQGHILYLSQIATYLAQTGMKPEEYAELLLQKAPLLLKQSDRYPHTIETALDMTLTQIPEPAKKWLEICAFLNPSHIPISYLDTWLSKTYLNKASLVAMRNQIKTALEEHALLRFDPSAQAFTLHLSIQKHLLSLPLLDPLDALDLLLQAGQKIDFETAKNWFQTREDAETWFPHAIEIHKLPVFEKTTPQNQALFLEMMADCEAVAGLYDRANLRREKSLEIYRNLATPLSIAKVLNKIGTYYSDRNNTKALHHLQEALDIYRTAYGMLHKDTGHTLLNIGWAQASAGKLQEALNAFQYALKAFEIPNEEDEVEQAQCWMLIAYVYSQQLKHDQALNLLRKAANVYESYYTEFHPEFINLLVNMISYYGEIQTNEGYRKGIEIGERVLTISKKIFAMNHPIRTSFFIILARFHLSLKETGKAFHYIEQAKKNALATEGTNSKNYGMSLYLTAAVHYQEWKFHEAIPLLEKSLEIYNKLEGTNSSKAQALHLIAICYLYRFDNVKFKEYENKAYKTALESMGESSKFTKEYKALLDATQNDCTIV